MTTPIRRVLFLNPEFPPLGGGAGSATRQLFLEYASLGGVEVDCITSATDGKFVIEEFASGVRIHRLSIGNKRSSLHFQTQVELLRYLFSAWYYGRRLMREKEFDLCHAFFSVPSGYIARKWKNRLPYIVSLRGSDVPGFNERFQALYSVIKPAVKRVWKDADVVVANSADLMDLAHRTNRGQDIKIIPNGTDVVRFLMSERGAQGQLRIVFTSRLIGRKGLTFLLQALEMLGSRLQDVRLTVAGDGDLAEQSRDEAKQRGISEYVTFLGAVDPDHMPEIYRNADVFVLPSLNEGMSNSLLEAMTAGLAVITTSTGGARDLVDGNGVIIPRRNAKTIADALLVYLNHRDLLERHCARSREIAEGLSWNNIARQYVALYDEVINKRAGARLA